MNEPETGPNGAASPPSPGAVTITLTLTPTPGGLSINVAHDPGLYPDTVIDACLRAARFYDRLALVASMREERGRQVQLERDINLLRRPLGGLS